MADLYVFQLPGRPMWAAKIIGGMERLLIMAETLRRLPMVA
jgi:hypothetical protein